MDRVSVIFSSPIWEEGSSIFSVASITLLLCIVCPILEKSRQFSTSGNHSIHSNANANSEVLQLYEIIFHVH